MDKIFKYGLWLLIAILVIVVGYVTYLQLVRTGVIDKDNAQYTTEESISLFNEKYKKSTKVATIKVDGYEVKAEVDTNGNSHITGTVDSKKIDLYSIDDSLYSCLSDVCVSASKDEFSVITKAVDKINDIPNLLTYGETVFEVEDNGDKKLSYKGNTATLKDDGSSIKVNFKGSKVAIELSFSDDKIKQPDSLLSLTK